jgi:hypothetical protein
LVVATLSIPQAFDQSGNALDVDAGAARILVAHDRLQLILVDLAAVGQRVTGGMTQRVRVAKPTIKPAKAQSTLRIRWFSKPGADGTTRQPFQPMSIVRNIHTPNPLCQSNFAHFEPVEAILAMRNRPDGNYRFWPTAAVTLVRVTTAATESTAYVALDSGSPCRSRGRRRDGERVAAQNPTGLPAGVRGLGLDPAALAATLRAALRAAKVPPGFAHPRATRDTAIP